jgi:hypothetical protein
MKHLKILGLAAVAAMAMMAFTAGSASATTLETGGTTTNSQLTITASLSSKVAVLKDTAGFSKNECEISHVHGKTTSPFTGSSVTGDIETLTFEKCTRPVTVHAPGKLEITWTSGTNGTVASEEAVVTVSSAIGVLTCETGTTTNLGNFTGVAAGNATLDINALLNCGIIPSAKWEGSYAVTSPAGLGVSS